MVDISWAAHRVNVNVPHASRGPSSVFPFRDEPVLRGERVRSQHFPAQADRHAQASGRDPRATSDSFDVEAYRTFVAAASSPGNLEVEAFFTRDPRQSAIAIEYLFIRAVNVVAIVTGCLDLEMYGDPNVCNAAIAFLDRSPHTQRDKPSIFILHSQHIQEEEHPLFLAVRNYEKDRGLRDCITTLRVPPEAQSACAFRFMVTDSKHYFFASTESDPQHIIKFNDPDVGQKIYSVFLGLWNMALRTEAAIRKEAPVRGILEKT